MRKLFISLACAAICCACDARHNTNVVKEQKNAETEAVANTEDKNEGTEAGQMAPDFTLKDTNGKSLSLSDLKGKYVIIDFWGSWCVWCIRGMPKMKEYYKKYSDKLEILGVDCNDPEQKWKDTVKRLELPWKNVYNPKNSYKILEDYDIQGFPTKILVDPQGKVVKYVCGEDPAFYTFLDEILK